MKMMANRGGARGYFSELRAMHIVRKTVPLYLLILSAIMYSFLFRLDMITTYMFYLLLCFVFMSIREHDSSILLVPNTMNMVIKGRNPLNTFEKPIETLIQLYHQDNKIELEEASSTVNMDEILHQLGGNICKRSKQ